MTFSTPLAFSSNIVPWIGGGDGDDTFYVGPLQLQQGLKYDGGKGVDVIILDYGGDISGLTLLDIESLSSNGNLRLTADQMNSLQTIAAASQQETFGITLTTAGVVDFGGKWLRADYIDLNAAGNTLVVPNSMVFARTCTVNGGAGDDVVSIGQVTPESSYGPINWPLISFYLHGGAGADTLSGGDIDDLLSGGPGVDTLNGGGGRDTLIGGQGGDVLTGGAGADTFAFRAVQDSRPGVGSDRILDFSHAAGDQIDLQELHQHLAYIGGAAFDATGAGEVRIEAHGVNQLVQVDVNGDGHADMAIRVMGGGITGSADFVL